MGDLISLSPIIKIPLKIDALDGLNILKSLNNIHFQAEKNPLLVHLACFFLNQPGIRLIFYRQIVYIHMRSNACYY
jgi:hypothetical protein